MGNATEKKKRKIKPSQIVMLVGFLVVGGVCGWWMGLYVGELISGGENAGDALLRGLLLFVGMYAAMFLQIIIHEGGHLIFGLLTGYGFASFRIGSLMWKKEGDSLKFCRFSLAGTGGQCLMTPPDMADGKFPYVLYNLGGSLANLISAVGSRDGGCYRHLSEAFDHGADILRADQRMSQRGRGKMAG